MSARRERTTGSDDRTVAVIVALLVATAAGGVAFVVLYLAFPDTQLLGVAIGGALLSFGIALAVAGKRLVPQEKAESEYHDFDDELETIAAEQTVREAREGVSRRGLIVGAGGAAAAAVGAAAVVPIASLGPSTGNRIFATPWRAGRRVVGPDDEPIRAADVEEATFLNGFPQGAEKSTVGAPLIIVRLALDELDLPEQRRWAAPEGIIAFSKICPHAGCAVSIYRHPSYEPTAPAPALVCPCHYSTFDPRRGGALEFGPAGRDLPQLPLRIGDDDVLEASGDFFDQPGPSYDEIRKEEP